MSIKRLKFPFIYLLQIDIIPSYIGVKGNYSGGCGGIIVVMIFAPEILDNKISRNSSGNWSGGIYIAHMTDGNISGNVIDNNKAIIGCKEKSNCKILAK